MRKHRHIFTAYPPGHVIMDDLSSGRAIGDGKVVWESTSKGARSADRIGSLLRMAYEQGRKDMRALIAEALEGSTGRNASK
jgi:hypothetical protein